MVISWIDPLSICLVCVVFYDLILICVVLVLFILTDSTLLFLYMLTWMIKLILGLVKFVTQAVGIPKNCGLVIEIEQVADVDSAAAVIL
jgi:hypothetical protein